MNRIVPDLTSEGRTLEKGADLTSKGELDE